MLDHSQIVSAAAVFQVCLAGILKRGQAVFPSSTTSVGERRSPGDIAGTESRTTASYVLVPPEAARKSWQIEDGFEEGLEELVRVLTPHTILVYGSANYPCFDQLFERGIRVISYPSHTASAFERGRTR